MRYQVTITDLGDNAVTMRYTKDTDALGAVLSLGSILAQNEEQGVGAATPFNATAYKIEIEVIR